MSRSDNWAPRKAAHNEPARYRRCWKGLILIRLSIMILHVLSSVTQLSTFSEPLHLEELAVHSLQDIQPEINVSPSYSKGHFLQIFTLPFLHCMEPSETILTQPVDVKYLSWSWRIPPWILVWLVLDFNSKYWFRHIVAWDYCPCLSSFFAVCSTGIL
jgi:hypothetical protein